MIFVLVIFIIAQILLVRILFHIVKLSMFLNALIIILCVPIIFPSLIFAFLFSPKYEYALYGIILNIIFVIFALVCLKLSGYRFPNMTIPDTFSKDKTDGI